MVSFYQRNLVVFDCLLWIFTHTYIYIIYIYISYIYHIYIYLMFLYVSLFGGPSMCIPHFVGGEDVLKQTTNRKTGSVARYDVFGRYPTGGKNGDV